MKKKLLATIITIFMVNSMLVGCGNDIVKKSIEQAETLIENKEYDKAILSLEATLDEDNKNEEANKLYRIVDTYQKAKKLVDNNNIDEAKKALDEIDAEYINYTVKEDIDSLKQQVEDKLKEIELINAKLTQLSSLVDEKKYDEANILFEEINKSSLNEEQKNKVNELKSRVDAELAEIEAEKRKQEEANRLAQQERTNYNNTSNEVYSGNSNSIGEMVWLSATGNKYHRINNCGRMNPAKATQVSIDSAQARGIGACSKCF